MADPATVSAIASVVSASSALLAGSTAFVTLKRKRPKLKVEAHFASRVNDQMAPNPGGDFLAVMISNRRDADVEVRQIWFQQHRAPVVRGWQSITKAHPSELVPPTTWYLEGAHRIPATAKSNHALLVVVKAFGVRGALASRDITKFRVVVSYGVTKRNRSRWVKLGQVSRPPELLSPPEEASVTNP